MQVSELLTRKIPVVGENEPAGDAVRLLRERKFDEYDDVYLTDADGRLSGQVPLKSLIRADSEIELSSLKSKAPIEVAADEKVERAGLLAIENHDADVAVVNADAG